MPSLEEHLRKANGNEAFADSIKASSQSEIDWKLIVLFYAAMHYVEAYLAKSQTHLRSHTTRDGYVTREANLKKIRTEYNHLKYFGYNARYEIDGFTTRDVAAAVAHFATVKARIAPLL